nr:hypothetical protein Iba_scaffold29795CG0020 [Ipomoea batatas]GMC74893.1 hypothetical protein Iba_scaffold34217CG0020 [Ipomoea batatas]GMC92049.1 hypothetical protein Iba_scaffold64842CG0020 [Ipomoea batatas]
MYTSMDWLQREPVLFYTEIMTFGSINSLLLLNGLAGFIFLPPLLGAGPEV